MKYFILAQFSIATLSLSAQSIYDKYFTSFWSNVNDSNWIQVANYGDTIFNALDSYGIRDTIFAQYFVFAAEANWNLEKYQKSNDLFSRCMQLYGGESNKSYPLYSFCIYGLGRNYSKLQDYELAEFYFLKLLDYNRVKYGTKDQNYLTCLFNVGTLYYEMGDFKNAEIYYKRVLEAEKQLPDYRPEYSENDYSCLCLVYNISGNYQEAISCYKQLLEIRKDFRGINHSDYQLVLEIIGGLYFDIEEFQKAEFYYRELLTLRKKEFGRNHPIYAESLVSMGDVAVGMKDYMAAEEYYNNALEVYLKNSGQKNSKVAAVLNDLGSLCQSKLDYEGAENYFIQSASVYRSLVDADSLDYAAVLNALGNLFCDMNEYSKAESYYFQSIEIIQKSAGENHVDFAMNANNIGLLFMETGNYDKAECYFTQAIDVYKSLLGMNNLEYAMSIQNLALLHLTRSEYHQAEKLLLQALSIYNNLNAEFHPNCVSARSNLGLVYYNLGNYKLAELYQLQSLEHKAKTLNESHPDYLMSLNNLGLLYIKMGDYMLAKYYFEKCIAIRRSYAMVNERDFAFNLSNLGLVNLHLGYYTLAESCYQDALGVIENIFSDLHPDYASSLTNFGFLYLQLGAVEKAEYFLKSSLDIFRTASGENSYNHALGLSNMGLLLMKKEEYTEALTFFEKALSIFKTLLGENHPDYAACCTNIAICKLQLDDLTNARQYFIEAQDIYYSNFGELHPDYASSVNNLGLLHIKMREFDKAYIHYNQSLEILKKIYGVKHPTYIASLVGLGLLSACSDSLKSFEVSAMSYFSACQSMLTDNLSLNSSVKQSFKGLYNSLMFPYFSYSNLHKVSAQTNLAAFNHWLFLNGWVADRDALISREIDSSSDTSLKVIHDEYWRMRKQLSNQLEQTNEMLINQGISIENEERQLDVLELELSSRLHTFNRINATYSFRNLQPTLATDEAYLDVINVPVYDFKRLAVVDSVFYIAYVVTSDTRNAPLIVNLGDGKQIDEILYPYIVSQTTNPTSTTMDGQVYNLLWKPLEEHLAGKTKIYLSPGGIYHSINPETIYHAETGKYLFEEKEIHLVNSGRSFVDQRIYGYRDYKERTALIMGAPNFDYAYVADSTLLVDNVSFTYQTMRDLSLDGNRRAAPLPATHSEVEGINQTLSGTAWNTQLLTGNDAMESNLKQMDSPRILHIATHGYFMEDVKPENDNGMRMMGMDVQRVAENPMLRSGLLLAGCNKTLADNTPLTGGDNGILTAYEAGLLDLSKTELVVLSACETGRGEILNGEGVQGLRKAMTDAGAEHILMSLWKVDDKVTSEYMLTFYGHYAQGKSIRESYNLTRNEIKQKYPQPYYWGAFVLVGE